MARVARNARRHGWRRKYIVSAARGAGMAHQQHRIKRRMAGQKNAWHSGGSEASAARVGIFISVAYDGININRRALYRDLFISACAAACISSINIAYCVAAGVASGVGNNQQ